MEQSNAVELAPSAAKRPKTATPRIDFTVDNIEAIKPPVDVERIDFKDTKVQGLYLRVTRGGVKTFSYIGRPKGGTKAERATIGKYPTIKPAEARAKAREMSGHQATGSSVTADGRAKRQEMTLSDLWTQYYAHIARHKKSPETSEAVWRLYIEPKYGRRRLSEIAYSELEKWHRELPALIIAKRKEQLSEMHAARLRKAAEVEERRKLRKHGPLPSPDKKLNPAPLPDSFTGETTANRCIEVVRAMYYFASNEKRRLYNGPNPAAQHQKYRETERSRFIRSDEFGSFFNALSKLANEDARDAIITSLLAAARKSNILSMRWDDVHLDQQEWALPGQFQKNGKPYVVPLVPELVDILQRRQVKHREFLNANPPKTALQRRAAQYVFPSLKSETGHIVALNKVWAQLKDAAGITDLRLHDLRRTMGSWQAKTGASLIVIGKSLNHKDQKATAIYAQLDIDPVRQSMQTATIAMLGAAGIASDD